MNEKIDILLATYNGEKYLREQIESILHQTYKNIHLIISDDKSIFISIFWAPDIPSNFTSFLSIVNMVLFLS